MTILIERAEYVVRDAKRVERDADVLIEGERIAQIGRVARENKNDWTVIDGHGRAVIPGFVNAHAHLYQSFLKGLRDDVPFVEWNDATLFPMARAIHQEYRSEGNDAGGYHWGVLSALEMIRGGVTCAVDMNMNMDSVFRAWRDVGMRGVSALAVVDRWIPKVLLRDLETTKAQTLELIRSWRNVHPRITVVIAPSTPFLCSRELLEWSRDTAAAWGIGLQIHLSESRYEVDLIRKETGFTPIAYAHDLRLLNSKTTAVHCVHATDEDIDILTETKATVVHCPKSNLKLANGFAPIPKMLARGVSVALATDGAASNDTLDMLEETRLAALLHKGVAEDATAMTARHAFRMATENGARALGIDAGTLDPGKLADLAIINLEHPHLMPTHDILNTLVYCAKSSDVATTIIGGDIVMRDGVIQMIDERAALNEAARYGARLFERGKELWAEERMKAEG
ncbi:MAG: amidohydrolase [Chloroflexota bacterium]